MYNLVNVHGRQMKMSDQDSKKSIQLVGLLMWRAGLLLAGGTGLYRTSKLLLKYVDLPSQIELGIGLIFSGVVVFAVAMIAERVIDIRSEGDLTQ